MIGLRSDSWLEWQGPLLAPPFAGAYLLKARKRVHAVTPIRPALDQPAGDGRRSARADDETGGVTVATERSDGAQAGDVIVYTDGACKGNPGPGGWGALLIAGEHRKELFGGEPFTTNNRMELIAAIEALAALKRPCRVQLYTDSQYVRKGITEWLPQWKASRLETADKKPVKNDDLWKRSSARSSGTRCTGTGSRATPASGQRARGPTRERGRSTIAA